MNQKNINTAIDENFQDKQATKQKMQLIMQKIHEELQTLEVEWLHLRGLVNNENNSKTKDLEPVNHTSKYDDIDLINSEQFSLTQLENISKEENDSSENEN